MHLVYIVQALDGLIHWNNTLKGRLLSLSFASFDVDNLHITFKWTKGVCWSVITIIFFQFYVMMIAIHHLSNLTVKSSSIRYLVLVFILVIYVPCWLVLHLLGGDDGHLICSAISFPLSLHHVSHHSLVVVSQHQSGSVPVGGVGVVLWRNRCLLFKSLDSMCEANA